MGKIDWRGHPEYDEWLRRFIPGHSAIEIVSAFNNRFPKEELTVTKLKSRESRLGIRQDTIGGRFAPGSIPYNKGMRLSDYIKDPEKIANIKRTQFKRGQEVQNERPVGTERLSKDGYIEVKVEPENAEDRAHGQWIAKQRAVWERANGRKLRKGEAVIFANGDKTDFDPQNLVLVTRRQLLFINRNSIPYSDGETLRAACALADLNAAMVEVALRPKRCKCCGREFKPRYKKQTRCDTCMAAGAGDRRTFGTGTCPVCGTEFAKYSPRSKYCPAHMPHPSRVNRGRR